MHFGSACGAELISPRWLREGRRRPQALRPAIGERGEGRAPALAPAFLRSRASVTLALLLSVKGSRIESAGVATMQKSRRPSSLGRRWAATLGDRLTAPEGG